MRSKLLLVVVLLLIVGAIAAIGGWQALRSSDESASLAGWYGIPGTAWPEEPPSDSVTAPIPARLTVTWNVATRQAKVYVGQTFTGIVGQGGEKAAKLKLRQIFAAMGPKDLPVVIDADPMLPFQHAATVLAAAGSISSRSVEPIVWIDPDQKRRAPTATAQKVIELAEVEAPKTIPSGRTYWFLVFHPPSGGWSAGTGSGELNAVNHAGLERWLKDRVKEHGQAPAAVVISVPKQLEWRQIQSAIAAIRAARIPSVVYRTKPPEPPDPMKPPPPQRKPR